MGWLPDNSLSCDTCENVLKAYGATVNEMLDSAIVGRWGMYIGKTIGGESFITMACRGCREGSHRRVVKKVPGPPQEDLWGE